MSKPIGDNGGLQRLIELVKIAFLRVDDALSRKAAKNHSHDISDVDGLSTALSGKASSTHYHNQSDVDGLEYTLSQKASVGHTHSQSDVTGLTDALAGKASISHTHAQSDVTGLTDALAGKASTSHTHAQSDVTGLTEALAGKASTSHTHPQGDVTGLTDALAGKASTSHTHSQSDVTGLADALAGKASTSHTHSQSDVTGLADALAGKASTSHTHAQSDVTGLTDALAGKASSSHAHGSITNGGAITANTTPESADYPIFGDNSDSGKLKRATFQDFHKAMVGQMSSGNADVVDGTEFLSSYASSSGFGESSAPNQIFKRPFIKVWNYIQTKISSVLGLTASQYGGNAATASSATNDGNGNAIASTYFPLAGRKAITGVYKNAPFFIHNVDFGNTSTEGIWRKFCVISTRQTHRNAVGEIHINARSTQGTIYLTIGSSATTPPEGANNTLNPSVKYLSLYNDYRPVYWRVNDDNELELWWKATQYYDSVGVTGVNFSPYFLSLGSDYNAGVNVQWTNVVSLVAPANLSQARDVSLTTLDVSAGDVLTIDGDNYQDYLRTPSGGIPTSVLEADRIILPRAYSTIFFDTNYTATISYILGATGSNVQKNGRRITVAGNWKPREESNGDGRFTQYLYRYRGGSVGASGFTDRLREAFEDFIYFNGTWYSKGY